MRHLLRIIAGIWLACQLAGVCAPAAVLAVAPVHAADDETACCPGLKPGQICPMHHTREGMRQCLMRNACGPSDASVVALAFNVGVLPDLSTMIGAADVVSTNGAPMDATITRCVRPDLPPPRARSPR